MILYPIELYYITVNHVYPSIIRYTSVVMYQVTYSTRLTREILTGCKIFYTSHHNSVATRTNIYPVL